MEYGGSYLCVCHTDHNVSHCEWEVQAQACLETREGVVEGKSGGRAGRGQGFFTGPQVAPWVGAPFLVSPSLIGAWLFTPSAAGSSQLEKHLWMPTSSP